MVSQRISSFGVSAYGTVLFDALVAERAVFLEGACHAALDELQNGPSSHGPQMAMV